MCGVCGVCGECCETSPPFVLIDSGLLPEDLWVTGGGGILGGKPTLAASECRIHVSGVLGVRVTGEGICNGLTLLYWPFLRLVVFLRTGKEILTQSCDWRLGCCLILWARGLDEDMLLRDGFLTGCLYLWLGLRWPEPDTEPEPHCALVRRFVEEPESAYW